MLELDAAFLEKVDAARAAWPGIDVKVERFQAFVAERLAEEDGALDALRLSDLWVACACADGDAGAVAALERWGFPSVDAALARLRLPDDERHEIKQILRARLFLPDGDRRPRIADYSGRGDLRGYIRVTATRLALNRIRDARHDAPAGEDLAAAVDDPELRHLKVRYRDVCQAALVAAVEGLGRRQRNLLRQHLLDGLQIQEIAALYRVHRVTASRWLEDARGELLDGVKRALRDKLGGDEDLASVMRLVRSQLDVSLPRLLG